MVVKADKNKHTLAKIIIILWYALCNGMDILLYIHIVVDVFVFGKLFEIARNHRRIFMKLSLQSKQVLNVIEIPNDR